MKNLIITLLLAFITCNAAAQQRPEHHRPNFDPAKFKADAERYITVEARLTPSEAAAFFPIYDEMKKEMRNLFFKSKKLQQFKPADEKKCREVIAEMDQLEIEMKQVQMNYHTRALTVIPATKLYDVIMAEEEFHRNAMRNATRPMR